MFAHTDAGHTSGASANASNLAPFDTRVDPGIQPYKLDITFYLDLASCATADVNYKVLFEGKIAPDGFTQPALQRTLVPVSRLGGALLGSNIWT